MNVRNFNGTTIRRLCDIFQIDGGGNPSNHLGSFSNLLIKGSLIDNKGIIPTVIAKSLFEYKFTHNTPDLFNDKVLSVMHPLIIAAENSPYPVLPDGCNTVVKLLSYLSGRMGNSNVILKVLFSNGNTYYFGKHIILDSSMNVLCYSSIDVEMQDYNGQRYLRGYIMDQPIKKFYFNINKELLCTDDKLLKSVIFKYFIPFMFCYNSSLLFGMSYSHYLDVEVRTFNDNEINAITTHVTPPDPIKLLQGEDVNELCFNNAAEIAASIYAQSFDKITVNDITRDI